MIGGYTALVEKLFIQYLRDMLRPHRLSKFATGLYKHKCNKNRKTYEHYKNRINRIEAERFFNNRNKDFQMWCDLMNWDSSEILKIVEECIEKKQDRLYGKRALQAYFKSRGDIDD